VRAGIVFAPYFNEPQIQPEAVFVAYTFGVVKEYAESRRQ
jgi:hypothetical protein